MRLIRIGNDIGISWSLYAKQEDSRIPYLLDGRDIVVLLDCADRHYRIESFAISGNTLSFVFYGKDQYAVGNYVITLIENPGKESQMVLDVRDVFALVRRSWEEGGDDDQDIETTVIEFESEVGTMIDERLIPSTIARVADVQTLLAGYVPINGLYTEVTTPLLFGGGVDVYERIRIYTSLDMEGYRVIRVADPVEEGDAATKKYVDEQIETGIGDRFVPKTGGEFIGPVSFSGGAHFLTDVDMENNRLTNVGDPIANADAVNKRYVDGSLTWHE